MIVLVDLEVNCNSKSSSNLNIFLDRKRRVLYTWIERVKMLLYLEGGEFNVKKVVVRKNESLDDALRRFKRSVTKAGTLQEARKREHYEKPSVKRKRKSEAARKRKKSN